MKTVTKIIFASALVFSAVAPQFAHAAYLENPTQTSITVTRALHVTHKRILPHRAIDANAYEPATAPTGVHFGIGSQR